MNEDVPPDTPLTPGLVHRLWLAGALPPGRYAEALDMARDDAAWTVWGRRLVLALAVGQMLAGVVFFFAYNWADLPGLVKIALVLGLVVACALASRLRLPALAQGALLFAAALLVGVVWAVFGQHYQTGADFWGLFALWAALILPWTLTANSAVLWVLWLVVAETGLGLFMDIQPATDRLPEITLAALPALALLAFEARPERIPRWFGLTALAAVLAVMVTLSVIELVGDRAGLSIPWAGTVGLLMVLALTVLRFWKQRHDLGALSLAVGAACVVVVAVIVDVVEFWMLSAFLIAALFAAAVSGLNACRVRS